MDGNGNAEKNERSTVYYKLLPFDTWVFQRKHQIFKIADTENALTMNRDVRRVPIIFSWENVTVQTLYNPKKSFLYKKIINNGKLSFF